MYLKNDSIKTMHVPQYKGLSIDDILEYISDKRMVEYYLPEAVDMPKIPKQWLVDVCATVLGDQFREWVID